MTNIFLLLLATFLKILLIIISILVSVAFFTLAERRLLASIQRRRGPNIIGLYGFLQPILDGVKLLLKEIILFSSSDTLIFYFAPIVTFMLSLIGWGLISFILPSFIWFSFKIIIFVILYIIARAILPRYRYDQLMGLGWKVFLSILIGYLVFTFCYMYGV